MRDLNAKREKEWDSEIIGKYKLKLHNKCDEKWVQQDSFNKYIISNTWFKEHPKCLWIWRSTGGDTKRQIGHITINKRFKNAVLHSKTYPDNDIPVIWTLRLQLQNLKKSKTMPELWYNKLQDDSICK